MSAGSSRSVVQHNGCDFRSLDLTLSTHCAPVQQAGGELLKVDVAIFVKVDAPHQALNLLLADIIALEHKNRNQVLDTM